MLATIDAVHAVASHLADQWSPTRTLAVSGAVVGGRVGGAIAECGASDGSRWFIVADRWGNIVGHFDTVADVEEALIGAER